MFPGLLDGKSSCGEEGLHGKGLKEAVGLYHVAHFRPQTPPLQQCLAYVARSWCEIG